MRPGSPILLLLLVPACGEGPGSTASAELDPVQRDVRDTAAIYRAALSDYIAAMDTTATPLPDTIFIGRHADFPSVELPERIAQRTIHVVDPGEVEQEKHNARFAYLNVFATFITGQVEFYVVRFGQGLRHHPDGVEDRHLYYQVRGDGGLLLDQVGR